MQPTVVGSGRRYLFTEVLGEDELGTLWRGTEDRSGTPVCVRLLHERLTSDPAAVHRAMTQLRRLQWRASNPHLAGLLHYELRGLAGRQAVVVYGASGETVARRLERGETLDAPAAVRLVAAIADGLAAAHAAWIYHGALTASSVLVDDDGDVAVIDVGLGELLDETSQRPANLTDRGPVDVLALAELVEQLLSGSLDRSVAVEGEVVRPWEADLPPDAAALLRRARSPHPRLRPDMAQLAAALGSTSLPDAPRFRTAQATQAAAPLLPVPGAVDAPGAVHPASRRETVERIAAVPEALEWARPGIPAVPARGLPFSPGRPRRRGALLAVLVACVVLAGIVAGGWVLLRGDGAPSDDHSTSPTGAPSPAVVAPVDHATVPNVLGLELGAATQLIEQAGLTMGGVTAIPGPEGVVIRTDPTPGEAVVAGRVIDVFIGDGAEG